MVESGHGVRARQKYGLTILRSTLWRDQHLVKFISRNLYFSDVRQVKFISEYPMVESGHGVRARLNCAEETAQYSSMAKIYIC
jgi:hypothetical protein